MKERVLTAIAIFFMVAVAILTKIVLGTTIVVDIVMGCIAILGAWEMSNILKRRGRNNNKWLIVAFPVVLYILGYIAIVCKLSLLILALMVIGAFVLFVLVSYFWALFARASTENEMRERKIRTSHSAYSFAKSMNTLIGCVYPSLFVLLMFPINHMVEFNYAFNLQYASTISIILVSLCFLIPFICDTFAYLVGKTFQGPKLCAKLSPNKTISGTIGGILATTLLIVVLYLILSSIQSLVPALTEMHLTWWIVAILAFVGSLFCVAGDLFESKIKRLAELKDSGELFPGHGGMLDRADGFCAVVLVVFVFTLII